MAQETSGAHDILIERVRQRDEEGYTPEHDMQHSPGTFMSAAKAYLLHAQGRYTTECLAHWPWESRSFKPSLDPRRDLVKAGALIAAAIDLIDKGN